MSETTDTLSANAYGDALVLETLTEMSLNTLEPSGLDLKTYTMVRIAGLVAMDAPPVSYAIGVEAAMEVLEPEDIQAVLVALAPVVGSARVAAASSNILDVYFDEVDDEMVEAEDQAAEPVEITVVHEVSEHAMSEDAEEALADNERELETV